MVYLAGDNIITSLGTDTLRVLREIENGKTGILNNTSYSSITRAPVSVVDSQQVTEELNQYFPDQLFTRFEGVALLSLKKVLAAGQVDPSDPRSLFILSTTKGNIELLKSGESPSADIFLYTTALKIASLTGFVNKPVVICNACISGVLALIYAQRAIESGRYDHVVVTGADVISEFIVAGFESFKSMSEQPCRPFDVKRDGLSLGEGAGTLLVTKQPGKNMITIVRGASANDANHISGPSRTGEGLYLAGKNTLKGESDIDYISAHGTATPYNDDMESYAIHRLSLSDVPVNSFKGYFGHTLGAAGIIESILTKHSMLNNTIYASLGLTEKGTVKAIHAFDKTQDSRLKKCLKLASGFGGCNAALLLVKNEN
jgi:3-oxoacyl-[acyl-carrier-protein] synthase-1